MGKTYRRLTKEEKAENFMWSNIAGGGQETYNAYKKYLAKREARQPKRGKK